MLRVPFAVSMLGLSLFVFGCEKRAGDDCKALCTDIFESCSTDCEDDEEVCTVTCEDDSEICLGSCDADSEPQD